VTRCQQVDNNKVVATCCELPALGLLIVASLREKLVSYYSDTAEYNQKYVVPSEIPSLGSQTAPLPIELSSQRELVASLELSKLFKSIIRHVMEYADVLCDGFFFFFLNKFIWINVYTNMQKKANIYIVKRRHFKVRSKKARYERDSLKSSHARPGVQLYHYMYSYIHIVHVRTLTDKTHTDWLHTNT
jgi:hypothetical protein